MKLVEAKQVALLLAAKQQVPRRTREEEEVEVQLVPYGRNGHCMATVDENKLVMFGGIVEYDNAKFASRFNDVWILNTNIPREAVSKESVSSAADFMPAIANEKRISNYIVDKMIGSGGQGVVFLVRDERSNQQFALKRIDLDFANEGEERQVTQTMAFNEVMIHQKLKHPNVLSVETFFLEKIKVENQERIRLNSMYMKIERMKIHLLFQLSCLIVVLET